MLQYIETAHDAFLKSNSGAELKARMIAAFPQHRGRLMASQMALASAVSFLPRCT
jgi:hypothetical protein